MKKHMLLLCACLVLVALLLPGKADAAENIQDFYGRNKLAAMQDGAKLVAVYDTLCQGITNWQEQIDLFDLNITAEQLKMVHTIHAMDHSGQYWIPNGYSYSYSSNRVYYVKYSYPTNLDSTKFDAAAKALLKCAEKETTEYGKALALHDALVKHITYDLNAPNAHNSYGGIVDGIAVCEGYAEAYQYLLQQVGIQCCVVTGTGNGGPHAWNLVRLDGNYYYTDVTWDDPVTSADREATKPIYYGYFNLTTAYLEEDHVLDSHYGILPECTDDSMMYHGLIKTSQYDVDTAVKNVQVMSDGTAIFRWYYTGEHSEDNFSDWCGKNAWKIVRAYGQDGTVTAGTHGREHILSIIPDAPIANLTVSGTISGGQQCTVSLENISTGQILQQTAAGSYSFQSMQPGTYLLTVSQLGMPEASCVVALHNKNVQKNITLYAQDDLVKITNALELEGSIGIHYYLKLGEGVSAPTMWAWKYDVEPHELTAKLRTDGRYEYQYDIYAMEMTDIIYAAFSLDKDGVTYRLPTYEYSAQAYARKAFASPLCTDHLRNLIAATMNYGAWAQQHFSYRTYDLANAVCTEFGLSNQLDSSQVSKALRVDGTDFAGTELAQFTTNALELNAQVALRFNFTLDSSVDPQNVYFAYQSPESSQVHYVKAQSNGTSYFGRVENVASYDLTTYYTGWVCVREGDTYRQISQTRSYSAECFAYAVLQQQDASFAVLKNCVTAMMQYCRLAQQM